MIVGFRKGLSDTINSQELEDGNFYLATDEKKLYLSSSDGDLIDLNPHTTVIQSINDLPILNVNKQIYLGETYYLSPLNMYLICTGIDSSTGQITWKQINQTKIEWGNF